MKLLFEMYSIQGFFIGLEKKLIDILLKNNFKL